MTIKREALDDAILAALEEATGKLVGDGRVPGDGETVPELPYYVLYPLPAVGNLGSMDDPNDLMIFSYQLTCVGGDRRQTSWASRRGQEVFTRTLHGNYATRIVGGGFQIAWRQLDGLGAITPQGELFNCVDTYRIAVGT